MIERESNLEPETVAPDSPPMAELEKQLVELDLDIAKAKRYRREQKSELKTKQAGKLDTGEIEKKIKKTDEAIVTCKTTRKKIIGQLLATEDAKSKDSGDAK